MIDRRWLIACMICNLTAAVPGQDLREAVRDGDIDQVKSILETGFDPNVAYENGYTSVFFAKDPRILDLLLKHGAELNVRAIGKITPLGHAAEQSYYDRKNRDRWRLVVEKLRRAGAEYTINAAIYLNDFEHVLSTIRNNAAWAKTGQGSDALRLAAETGRVEFCKALLDAKADPDAFERGGGYPIIKSAAPYPAIVRLLIDHGANLKRRISWQGGKSGYWIVDEEATALHFAVESGNFESVRLLIDAGLDPNATDAQGQTPLHIAIIADEFFREQRLFGDQDELREHTKIVKYLLQHDASLSLTDKRGKTVLELADEVSSRSQLVVWAKTLTERIGTLHPYLRLKCSTEQWLHQWIQELVAPNDFAWLIRKRSNQLTAQHFEALDKSDD